MDGTSIGHEVTVHHTLGDSHTAPAAEIDGEGVTGIVCHIGRGHCPDKLLVRLNDSLTVKHVGIGM